MNLKLLLKRGALLAAANWQTVAIQFAAQTTFQMLLAVPIVGAAILVAVMLGADLANLLQGSLREIFTATTDRLVAEPVALIAFVLAFSIVLVGGSVFMFLVKGGTVDVLIAAHDASGPVEDEPITLDSLRPAAAFSLPLFMSGCGRLFKRYLALGITLTAVYGLSASAYLAFVVVGYRAAGESDGVLGWAFVTALSAVVLVLWITLVNLVYLLMQIAMASENIGLADACRAVTRFVRAEFRELGGVFLVVLGMVIAATLASALAWSGVGLDCLHPARGPGRVSAADRGAAPARPRLRVHRADRARRVRHALPASRGPRSGRPHWKARASVPARS